MMLYFGGVVTTTVVLHVAATPSFIGNILRCVSSIGIMFHQ
jgi:hypothetical protein